MKRNPENTLKLLLILLIITLSLYTGVVSAQSNNNNIPQVFFIGEFEKEYDQLINKHNELLLAACNNSMEKAYDHWIDVMHDLENYAEKNQFDLKGVKIWANIFWDTNGKINHFVFYPKPNSKNIDYEKMKLIVEDFVKSYDKHNIAYKKYYSHYGAANFPVYAKLAEPK